MLSKLAIALVTLSVLGSHALTGALYACAMEGTVHRHSCCCAGADGEAPASTAISNAMPECCTLSAAPSDEPAMPAADGTPSVAPSLATVLALVEVLATAGGATGAVDTDLPGPEPPDVYLENCALLI